MVQEISDLPIPEFIDEFVPHPEWLQNRKGEQFAGIAVVLDRGERSGLLDEVAESMARLHSLSDTQVLLVVPARPAKHPPRSVSEKDTFWGEDYPYRAPTYDSYWFKENQYWNRVQKMRRYGDRGAKAERELKTEIILAVNEIRDYLGVPNDVIPSVLILCLYDKVAMFLGSGMTLPLTKLFKSLANNPFYREEVWQRYSLAEMLREIAEDAGLDERINLGALKPEIFAGWSAEHLRAKPVPSTTSEKSRG